MHGSCLLLWIFLRFLKCKLRHVMKSERPTALQRIYSFSLTRGFHNSFPLIRPPKCLSIFAAETKASVTEITNWSCSFRDLPGSWTETQNICLCCKPQPGNILPTVYCTTASIFSVETHYCTDKIKTFILEMSSNNMIKLQLNFLLLLL